MKVAALFASHTPLLDYCPPPPAVTRDVDECLATVRRFVADFAPELVIAVGPDHFNGFFYRLMPSFCIGTTAVSVGDWNTPAGPLPVPAALAEDCVRTLHAAGIDVAVSHRMDVDHGITQLLQQVFTWSALPPVIPLFVNCAAPPLPPLPRALALGTALGEFARTQSVRVLLAASGGLSHDPPIPSLASAPPPVRERLIAGGPLTADARAARQERVLAEAAAQTAGTSTRLAPDPAWDQLSSSASRPVISPRSARWTMPTFRARPAAVATRSVPGSRSPPPPWLPAARASSAATTAPSRNGSRATG